MGATKPLERDDKGRPVWARRADGRPICGAHPDGARGPCRSTSRKPNGRCRNHGGDTPSGPASANWKHGQRSDDPYWKGLAGGMLEGYLAVSTDEQILSLREQIRLWSARERELFARHAIRDAAGQAAMPSEAAWAQARELMLAIDDARTAAGDAAATKLAKALNELRVILLGDHSDAVWKELRDATLVVRRLKESERRLLETRHQMLSADQAMHLARMLTAIALKNILDDDRRRAFVEDVRRLSIGDRVDVDPHLLPAPRSA